MPEKPDSVKPLTGMLDVRSSPDAMPPKAMRWRQNFKAVAQTLLRRRPQFEKFLNTSNYNNQDLHDQLLSLRVKYQVRQPITLVFPATATNGTRYIFAATESTIYALNEATGNWKIIADGYGTGETASIGFRFYANQVGDIISFTNGIDLPFYHPIGQAKDPTTGLFVEDLSELELIGVATARVTWQFRGVSFFADVIQDGERKKYRIIWGDKDNPTSFDPAKEETLAGEQDLYFNEQVLGAKETIDGNVCLVYTTHGVWRMTAVADDRVFIFKRIYGDDDNREGCLKYRNSLVSIGDSHLYASDGDIYIFNQFMQKPQLVPWIHSACSRLFENINQSECDAFVSTFVSDKDASEVWLSYPFGSNRLATETLILNTRYSVADYMDHGFTSLCEYYPDPGRSIRDFILANGICTQEGLAEQGFPYDREGLPISPLETPAFTPTHIYTATPLSYGDGNVEDYTKETGDSDSLCALLGAVNLSTGECRKGCVSEKLLVGVSSVDWCIKQIGRVFYREICVNPTAVGTSDSIGYHTAFGSYTLQGFESILRPAPLFGTPNDDVSLSTFEIEYIAVPAVSPAALQFRMGQSSQISDPNSDPCALKWIPLTDRELKCLSVSAATQIQQNSRPAETAHWRFEIKGHYVYFELKISGTGGDCKLSRLSTTGKPIPSRNR
jgi:hypothetical protein